MPESKASFTGVAAAIAVLDLIPADAPHKMSEDATLPIRVGDLRELLRRYERAVETKEQAERQCERMRKRALDAEAG